MTSIRQGAEKCVLSLRVARELIEQGFRVVDIGTSHKRKGYVVVKFDNTHELNKALDEIRRKIQVERESRMFTD